MQPFFVRSDTICGRFEAFAVCITFGLCLISFRVWLRRPAALSRCTLRGFRVIDVAVDGSLNAEETSDDSSGLPAAASHPKAIV